MLGWFQALMPREERFFDLFEKHAQTLVAGSRHLRAVLMADRAYPRTVPAFPPKRKR
jgi:hypothetical protein